MRAGEEAACCMLWCERKPWRKDRVNPSPEGPGRDSVSSSLRAFFAGNGLCPARELFCNFNFSRVVGLSQACGYTTNALGSIAIDVLVLRTSNDKYTFVAGLAI